MSLPLPGLIETPDVQLPVRLLVAASSASEPDLRLLHTWTADARSELVGVVDRPHATFELAHGTFDAVLVFLGDRPEEELIQWREMVRAAPGRPALLALAHHPTMELVLLADRLGVLDILALPLQKGHFLRTLDRLSLAAGETSQPLPRTEYNSKYALVGRDGTMLEVYKRIAQVAPSSATVLIQGASGTGKEVVARAIHAHGPRGGGPFVAVNCAAIPEALLESELFGHERGAFTGALNRRIGKIELAAGGTLFLDEIADMSLPLQAKILRAIQEREVERVGGLEPISVDLRIIAATNRDLFEAIAEGRFREDLYYRLAVMTIVLPRLNARGDDLLLLVGHFTRTFAARAGKAITRISHQALDLLKAHEWSGNVRELRNVVERATILATGDTIRAEHLPDEFRAAPAGQGNILHDSLTLVQLEYRHITRVLSQVGGQIGEAAALLGIHRNTLARKLKEHGL